MRIHSTITTGLALILAIVPGATLAAEPDASEGARLRLIDHMPQDPLLAFDIDIGDPTEILDSMLDMVTRMDAQMDREQMDAKMAEIDATLGISLRNELLAQIGPEFGVVLDLPPIDEIMASASDPVGALTQAMQRFGLIVRVRDGERVDRALRALFAKGEASITEADGLVTVALTNDAAPDTPAFELFYGVRDGVLAMSVNADWVQTSMDPRDEGDRLVNGSDFQRAFEHLDAEPTSFSYVNLPRLAQMIESSEFVQAMRQSDPDVGMWCDLLVSDEWSSIGIGSTTVEIGDGVRTSSFGPKSLSGGAMMGGIVAAIAIPNFLNAVDRGKQKRTMADLRSLATTIESFSIDNNRYPGPTEGWADVSALQEELSPVYIRSLPAHDGWGHDFLVWSDGNSYRLVSPGKDGEVDRDWLGEIEAGSYSEFNADIVFADGTFVAWPEGAQN